MESCVSSLTAGKWSSFMSSEGNKGNENYTFHSLPAVAVVGLLLSMPQKRLYMLNIPLPDIKDRAGLNGN